MKRRIIKSPIEFLGAETVLLQNLQCEIPNQEFKTMAHPMINRRPTPERVTKSLKKSQSAEIIKVVNEKNLEIKKLQEEKVQLSFQISQLVTNAKTYEKLKSKLKKKNQTIERLRKFSQTSRGSLHKLENEQCKSFKTLKKKISIRRPVSRLSIDSGVVNLDQLIIRPMTAANKGVKGLNKSHKHENELGRFQNEMKNIVLKTEKILKGWKNLYKGK